MILVEGGFGLKAEHLGMFASVTSSQMQMDVAVCCFHI